MLSLFISASSSFGGALEEVMVTAEKRQVSVQDVPIAISAFDAADLERFNIKNSQDISRYTAGLNIVNGTGGNGNMQAYSRGLGVLDTHTGGQQRIGMYLDGVYLGSAIGGIFDLVDIERVEVLKGPQGTLYGRNTIGGAINVIAQKPGEEFEGVITALYGDDNEQLLRGLVNIPLGDKLFARLSANHRTMDGLYENTNPGHPDLSDQDKAQAGRIALRWLVTDKLTADYSYDKSEARDSTNAFWITGFDDPSAGSCNSFYFAACINDAFPGLAADNVLVGDPNKIAENDTFYQFDSYRHTLIATYDVSDKLTIKSLTASFGYDRSQATDQDGTAETLFRADKDSHYDSIQQEFHFIGTAFEDRLDYTLGATYFQERTDSLDTNHVLIDVPLPFGLDISSVRTSDTENVAWGVYGQLTAHLTEATQITVGTRYSEDDKESATSESSPAGVFSVPLMSSKESWDNVSSLLRLSHHWNEAVMTYVSWSQGYNAGGYPFRVSEVEDQTPYDEETVETIELGIKSTWLDRRLLINAAAYTNDYQDQQVTAFENGVTRIQNAGESKIEGVELEVRASPTDDLFLQISYAYTEARYTDFGDEDPDLFEFALTPRNTASALIEYSLLDNEVMGRWTVSGSAEYKGSQNFLLEVVQNDHIRSNSYTVYDATLRWERAFKTDALTFTLKGSNLGNKVYKTNGIDFSPLGWWGNNYGDPRRVTLQMDYRF